LKSSIEKQLTNKKNSIINRARQLIFVVDKQMSMAPASAPEQNRLLGDPGRI
jgi:hypothetical protein